jgi:carboxyl-terminal processing protease
VLVNENSASASEAFSGALQDHKKAKIIGTKTFGKGSVQQMFPLSNNGVLKVTVNEYLTPNQRVVNKKGLLPDIKVDYGPAQLIKAVELASKTQKTTLTVNEKQQLLINGTLTDERIHVVKEKNSVYLPVGLLLSMLKNGQLQSNKNGTVVIKSGAESKTFNQKSGILMKNDETFVNPVSFIKEFKTVKFSNKNQVMTLSN